MSHEGRRLVAQRIADEREWRLTVRAALRLAHGSVAAAARALRVSVRTVWRWIDEDMALRDDLAALRRGDVPPPLSSDGPTNADVAATAPPANDDDDEPARAPAVRAAATIEATARPPATRRSPPRRPTGT